MELVIASNNKNKLKEIKELLKDLDINILSLNDIKFFDEIEENGTTFSENSYIKAKTIYDKYHIAVLSDDSGLSVDALNGAPGVYSHRYAGLECDDHKNNLKLISELKDKKRDAKYVCDICYINKNGVVNHANGECFGKIIDTPRGSNGFGYDPYFYIESLGKTMAEIDMTEKNKISHRSIALKKIKEIIYEDFTR